MLKKLPSSVRPYRRTPEFNQDNIPKGLLEEHQTKAGVYGVINVVSGSLGYLVPASGESIILTPDIQGIIEPEVLHNVKPEGAVTFFVEFWK